MVTLFFICQAFLKSICLLHKEGFLDSQMVATDVCGKVPAAYTGSNVVPEAV